RRPRGCSRRKRQARRRRRLRSAIARRHRGVPRAEDRLAPDRHVTAFSHLDALVPHVIWPGVTGRSVVSENATFSYLELDPDTHVPEHAHPNEQVGVLLRGSLRFRIGQETADLTPGATWCILADVPHEVWAGPDGAALRCLEQVPASRRLSQRISEGDGIAIIVCVDDAEGARAAEADGAKAVAVRAPVEGIRDATTLPLLWIGDGAPGDADAVCVRPDAEVQVDGVEAVVDVRDEEELEEALEQLDPEIFLLSAIGS